MLGRSLLNDLRWSYKGLLPYFRMTEHRHSADLDMNEHRYNGRVHRQSVTSTGRHYHLCERTKAAWESCAVIRKVDADSGSPQGMGELVENLNDGVRQRTSTIHPLAGVQVMAEGRRCWTL